MSVMMERLKRAKAKIPETEPEQGIKVEKKAALWPANIMFFTVVFILAIAIAMVIFSRLNANIRSITQSSHTLEYKVGNVENILRNFDEELKASNSQIKDLTANMVSLEKKTASSEEGAKNLLSEIEGMKTVVKSLQNEYNLVLTRIAELQKSINMLAVNTVEKK